MRHLITQSFQLSPQYCRCDLTGETALEHRQAAQQGAVLYPPAWLLSLIPPALQFEPDDGEPGTALLSNGLNLNYNLSPDMVYAYTPDGGAFTATTSLGVVVGRLVTMKL